MQKSASQATDDQVEDIMAAQTIAQRRLDSRERPHLIVAKLVDLVAEALRGGYEAVALLLHPPRLLVRRLELAPALGDRLLQVADPHLPCVHEPRGRGVTGRILVRPLIIWAI
jgi:hypothetical protein